MLYHQNLDGWNAWGREYQNIPAFTPLIREIYRLNGLDFEPLTPLTPGTNAVFRSGKTVVKIYTPEETGLSGKIAFDTELFSMRHSGACGFPAPRALAAGAVADKYLFHYIIMEHIDAPEFLAVRPSLNHDALIDLAAGFGQKLRRLNIPIAASPLESACARVPENRRWKELPPAFHAEARKIAAQTAAEPQVYVHGDLNGDNVLFKDGDLYVIDFADSSLAPDWYETACVVCDLFGFDPDCAWAFTGLDGDALADRLYRSILLHEFGANIILQNVCRRLGSDAAGHPDALRRLLIEWARG